MKMEMSTRYPSFNVQRRSAEPLWSTIDTERMWTVGGAIVLLQGISQIKPGLFSQLKVCQTCQNLLSACAALHPVSFGSLGTNMSHPPPGNSTPGCIETLQIRPGPGAEQVKETGAWVENPHSSHPHAQSNPPLSNGVTNIQASATRPQEKSYTELRSLNENVNVPKAPADGHESSMEANNGSQRTT